MKAYHKEVFGKRWGRWINVYIGLGDKRKFVFHPEFEYKSVSIKHVWKWRMNLGIQWLGCSLYAGFERNYHSKA